MYLDEIFKGSFHKIYGKTRNISSIAVHSAIIGEDCLFFAHNGAKHSAMEAALSAVNAGAVAVCTDDFEALYAVKGIVPVVLVPDSRYAESFASDRLYPVGDNMKIVGVTGTNGKTSVCHIAHRIFSHLGSPSAYTGTLGTNIEGYEEILSNTTPPPCVYRKIVSSAEKEGMEYIFSEVSSEGILYKRTSHIPFHALIFTNLTPEHLNTHKNMESYYNVKKSVFTENECFYIINTDDSYGKRLYEEISGVKFSVGTADDCDIKISDITEDITGISFCLCFYGEEKITIISSLYGRFNAYNIALASALMFVEGFSPKEIGSAANEALCDAVPGRMEKFCYNGSDIFVDYAHTPDALKNALSSIRKITDGKIITVFGCGGERDKTKRGKMGKIACMYSDEVILTEDNSRGEETKDIINDIYFSCDKEITDIYPDRKQAIVTAFGRLNTGDSLLIAGRGAEEYLHTKSGKIKFSDRETVRYLCKM